MLLIKKYLPKVKAYVLVYVMHLNFNVKNIITFGVHFQYIPLSLPRAFSFHFPAFRSAGAR